MGGVGEASLALGGWAREEEDQLHGDRRLGRWDQEGILFYESGGQAHAALGRQALALFCGSYMRSPLAALPPDHRGGLLGKGMPSTTVDCCFGPFSIIWRAGAGRVAGPRRGVGGRVLWGRVMGGLVARSDSRLLLAGRGGGAMRVITSVVLCRGKVRGSDTKPDDYLSKRLVYPPLLRA